MTHKLLDTVVLTRDVPEHGLACGDVGAVVEVMPPDGLAVEFVTGNGSTQALLMLREQDVRAVGDDEVIAVRRLRRSA
ncbi:MAG: DUF4926 domain-containing protein [Phycisphaerales bacterium]